MVITVTERLNYSTGIELKFILINPDHIKNIAQYDDRCIIYMTGNKQFSVSETLVEIKSLINGTDFNNTTL